MAEENTTEPTTEEIEKKKEAEELAKAEEKFKELAAKMRNEANFKEVDDRRYSFVFKKMELVFRIPDMIEKAKITSLLDEITIGGIGVYSATDAVYRSGKLDVMYNSTAATHVTILLDKSPKTFNPDALSNEEQLDLGALITVCEREFLERKKKASPDEQ